MAKTKTGKRRQKYNYNANRRKMWKKKRKLPSIKCEEIKEAWDNRKSVQDNLRDMGLSANPNKTLRIKTTMERLKPSGAQEEMETNDVKQPNASKSHVAKNLQKLADLPSKKRERISEPMVNYCIYMMEKYGDDYKAMARDVKNYYQDTPKQIKKKIAWFKNCGAQYKKYLAEKSGQTVEADSEDVMTS